jgi:signal transduction histidine kinase
VCRVTGLGFSAVARVTEDRWIACAVRDEIEFGLQPGGELKVVTTICCEIRDSGRLVAIDHASQDEVYCHHPTPQMYGFQSYISVPIQLPGGELFGTLCAIDPKPARVNTPETIGMFTLFANLIALHLDAQQRLHVSQTALLDERQRIEVQDQFIAVLGHDLRNPLSAVQTGAKMLLSMPLDTRATNIARVIDRSAARMTGLIDNVLDFARGRLGGGLTVTRAIEPALDVMLDHVVTEMRTSRPDRTIDSQIEITRPVMCDRVRIGQLLSNLLANALTHGDPAGPVRVRARSDEGGFELSVANHGEPIQAATMERLFQPFARASNPRDQGGLGLGLYIVSEIARAHGGRLEVESTSVETRFTFRIPSA